MSAQPAPATPDTPRRRKGDIKPKSRKKLWVTLSLVLLAAGGGGAAWWFLRPAPAKAADATPVRTGLAQAQYFALEPAFVVNLADEDAVRYLQADVQLVTRDAATAAAFQTHAPAIRNRLLLLFGQQSSALLMQRSGKERLQDDAREEVRRVLKSEQSPYDVEAVIFTSLVTQ